MKVLALAVTMTTLGAAAQMAPTNEQVYEAGPEVSLPRVIKSVHPQYDAESMQARVSGEVLLKCIVTRDGKPIDIVVEKGLTERLNANAVEALASWEFEPGRRRKDNEPVAVRITVQMTFTLK